MVGQDASLAQDGAGAHVGVASHDDFLAQDGTVDASAGADGGAGPDHAVADLGAARDRDPGDEGGIWADGGSGLDPAARPDVERRRQVGAGRDVGLGVDPPPGLPAQLHVHVKPTSEDVPVDPKVAEKNEREAGAIYRKRIEPVSPSDFLLRLEALASFPSRYRDTATGKKVARERREVETKIQGEMDEMLRVVEDIRRTRDYPELDRLSRSPFLETSSVLKSIGDKSPALRSLAPCSWI